MNLNNFEKVFYINCDHRTDRKESIESMFNILGFDSYQRISACYIPENGALGCAKSHLLALKEAKLKNYKNCLILEDDFILNVSVDEFNKNLNLFFEKDLNWDIVMISANVVKYSETDYNFLLKVNEAQTTSGYAIKNHYFDKIISNFEEAESLLSVAERVNGWYSDAIDQHWKKIQVDNWYTFNPRLGKQSDGWSDIEEKYVNYGC